MTNFERLNIDKNWTIFLDRDGVINQEKREEYILNWKQFKFYEGALESIQRLTKLAGKIIVVTNQRGVGKGIISNDDLIEIHTNMKSAIELAGGNICGIYACTNVADNHPNRKPNTGMAIAAQNDFPDINFSKSIMVGNKLSDMQFGRNAGMFTVFIATTHPETEFPNQLIDLRFDSLIDFVKAL